MLLIGCCGNTRSYRQIASMGYDYAELSARQIMTLSDDAFEDFLAEYRQVGFPCRGFNDYCGPEHPIVGPGRDDGQMDQYIQVLCQRGAAMGIGTIGIGAPLARKLPAGYPADSADGEMEQFLRRIAAAAAPYGITILVEAVHQYLCDYMTYTRQALEMTERVDLPNVKMVLDYYQALVMGEDIHQMAYVMPYVRHLHVSTDEQDHYRGFLRQADQAELTAILSQALENGYSGGVSVEAAADRLETDGPACAIIMRQAARQALEQAGL